MGLFPVLSLRVGCESQNCDEQSIEQKPVNLPLSFSTLAWLLNVSLFLFQSYCGELIFSFKLRYVPSDFPFFFNCSFDYVKNVSVIVLAENAII